MRIRSIPTGRQRRKQRAKTAAKFLALLMVAGAILAAGSYFYFSLNLPKLKGIDDYRPTLPTIMYDRDGNEVSRFFTENREIVSIDQVPRQVINAILAIEDSKYYEHKGIDFLGIFRAFIKNMQAGRVVQGGSTITQQVAKSLLLSNEKKYSRKIKEAILARRMHKEFTKDEILAIYLNQSYFGHGSYGIEAASLNYFQKHVWELSTPEIAMLAGLPKAPSAYDPTRNPDRAKTRRNLVLERMAEEKYLTETEWREAAVLPLGLNPLEIDPLDPTAYFGEEVRRHLYETYGEDALYRGGMKVYTTLDSRLQKFAQSAVRTGLLNLDKRQGFRGPLRFISSEDLPDATEQIRNENGLAEIIPGVTDELPWTKGQLLKALVMRVDKDGADLDLGGVGGYIPLSQMKWARPYDTSKDASEVAVKRSDEILSAGSLISVRYLNSKDKEKRSLFALEQEPLAEAALICMDAPTGQVLAMIGGYDFNRSEFNRASQAIRQPGSAFKPLVYSAAMDNGFTPSSIIVDSPIIYDDPAQELKWKPANYSEKFYGPTTLRTGIVKSRNVITIKLVQKLGIQAVIQYAKRFGIQQEMEEDLSIALGSMGLTPLDLTAAYTVFSNLGLRASPWFITKVEDRDGNVLEQGGAEMVRSLSEDTAFIMQNLLRGVVQSGTGWRARAVGYPSGGKTGTSNDQIDAWYMGFTPKIVTGTWVGFDEEATLGPIETGSRAAAPIWVDFMTKAMEDQPVLPFPPPPPGIEMVKVDPDSGLLAGSGADRFLYEAFKIGTAPREYARTPGRSGGQFGGRSYTPGYVPQSDVPGLLPRDF